MEEETTAKPARRGNRKLSRPQIQDILERNISLYQDEESFVPYLVELAIYLLEYEYDWDESGRERPAAIIPEDAELDADNGFVEKEGKQILQNLVSHKQVKNKECPHCGMRIADEYICPGCRNLTR